MDDDDALDGSNRGVTGCYGHRHRLYRVSWRARHVRTTTGGVRRRSAGAADLGRESTLLSGQVLIPVLAVDENLHRHDVGFRQALLRVRLLQQDGLVVVVRPLVDVCP
jgi:hypothetical protein